jgi:hypoxanthine phosphoribosyltransferase
MSTDSEKMYLSWEDVKGDAQKIATAVVESGKQIDWIIGVTVGGLIPLAFIAKALKTQHVTTISARSYTVDDTPAALQVLVLPQVSLTGKHVLLVDEIADSGATLVELKALLMSAYAPASVTTATVCVNTLRCKHQPDIAARPVTQWVVFPWGS